MEAQSWLAVKPQLLLLMILILLLIFAFIPEDQIRSRRISTTAVCLIAFFG